MTVYFCVVLSSFLCCIGYLFCLFYLETYSHKFWKIFILDCLFENFLLSIFCSLSESLAGKTVDLLEWLSEFRVYSSVSVILSFCTALRLTLRLWTTRLTCQHLHRSAVSSGLFPGTIQLLQKRIFQALPVGYKPGCQHSGSSLERVHRCLFFFGIFLLW